MTVLSARTFLRSPSTVTAMAQDGPIFVTECGTPTIVVLNIRDYEDLTRTESIRDSLRMSVEVDDFVTVTSRDLGRVAD